MGAAFTPVRKVNYTVEATRVQSNTNFERLVLEVWTNGTILPANAISEAAKILKAYFDLFSGFEREVVPALAQGMEAIEFAGEPAPFIRIEELDFSVRTYNCLKKANILTIPDLVQYTESDLMQIRNFGRKSLTEVREKLNALGQSLKGGSTVNLDEDDTDNETESENE
jgi:DNA-directed RNA polymerase subunit alpha